VVLCRAAGAVLAAVRAAAPLTSGKGLFLEGSYHALKLWCCAGLQALSKLRQLKHLRLCSLEKVSSADIKFFFSQGPGTLELVDISDSRKSKISCLFSYCTLLSYLRPLLIVFTRLSEFISFFSRIYCNRPNNFSLLPDRI
jgi:hypothetical protein